MKPNDINSLMLESGAQRVGGDLLGGLVFVRGGGDGAVDVMPGLEEILGFSTPWYPLALETAALQALPSGTVIRLVAAPVFLATQLEAFSGRGNNDYLFSHDLGDFLAVIDGRDSLIDDCRASRAELRA